MLRRGRWMAAEKFGSDNLILSVRDPNPPCLFEGGNRLLFIRFIILDYWLYIFLEPELGIGLD